LIRGKSIRGTTAYQLKYGPDPKAEYVATFENLCGGLNIRDLEYQLTAYESPDMLNMNWNDGIISSRDGQVYIDDTGGDILSGLALTCYEYLCWGYVFAHVGTTIAFLNPDTGNWQDLNVAVPEVRGTFFRYQDDLLMYKTRGAYVQIKRVRTSGNIPTESIVASYVEPYVPITAINCDPTTGGGDYYQPVNRLTLSQIRKYNAEEGVVEYHIPEIPYRDNFDPIVEIKVDGVVQIKGDDYSGEWDDTVNGYTISFETAPPVADPPVNNSVEIKFKYPHDTNYESIDSCRYATVYGGDTNICVVMGGCSLQPNAYFWSGNDSISMNPGYFPDIYYNFAGESYETITGFGRQQNLLVVFKRDSIGKATYGLTELNGRASITMDYVSINTKFGCDLPWTIQLVENNLVFCHSKIGVCILLDSSSAHENNIAVISDKVNGNNSRRGLLSMVARHDIDRVCSADTDGRYFIAADGEVFEWDYTVSNYKQPTWFRHNNIDAVAFWQGVSRSAGIIDDGQLFGHINISGRVTRFERN